MAKEPEDLELGELAAKVDEMAKWLHDAFHADSAEDDFVEGCCSCEAGLAIKHLRNIKTELARFLPSPSSPPTS